MRIIYDTITIIIARVHTRLIVDLSLISRHNVCRTLSPHLAAAGGDVACYNTRAASHSLGPVGALYVYPHGEHPKTLCGLLVGDTSRGFL